MPVFGKSLFETVLEGLEPEETVEEEEVTLRRPRVVAHFLAETSYGERTQERPLGAIYEDFDELPPVEPEAPVIDLPPEWLERLSEQDVADDLALVAGMSPAEIRERRRAFARANHPDRVAEEFREAANTRMTIANRLVEAALRKA